IGQVFGDAASANGLMQALAHGRGWLGFGIAGLVLAAVAASMAPGREQSRVLLVGGIAGLAGLLIAGFTIGARGWAFESFNALFGELAAKQPGVGWGGFVVL